MPRSLGLFDHTEAAPVLRIFDFDETITIKPSFKVPDDELSVRSNIKKDIRSTLGSLFAICSYVDSFDSIIRYLSVIFGEKPTIQEQKDIYVACKKYGREVHAYTLTVLSLAQLAVPVCITTLPKRTGVDKETGERNLAYKMARAALTEHGEKNHPITAMIQYYLEQRLIKPNHAIIQFYDDDKNNVLNASALNKEFLPVDCYVVISGTDEFESHCIHRNQLATL